jgi:hypothetical protein
MAATPPGAAGPAPRIAGGAAAGGAAVFSKAPVGLFTLAALATTAWMMKDTYHGNRERTNQQVDEMKENNDWRYTEYGWGHWSGMPGMDHFAHRVYGWTQYGPFGLFEKFREMKIRIGSFFSNVIMPNLIPIAISIAGLYGTFGTKAVHAPFKAIGKALMTPLPQQLRQDLWSVTKKAFSSMGSGLKTLLSLPFRSLTHLGIASGLLFFGAYFMKRFSDAYGHDGQREFFRDDIYNRHNDV